MHSAMRRIEAGDSPIRSLCVPYLRMLYLTRFSKHVEIVVHDSEH
jgi:hypothetical protein